MMENNKNQDTHPEKDQHVANEPKENKTFGEENRLVPQDGGIKNNDRVPHQDASGDVEGGSTLGHR